MASCLFECRSRLRRFDLLGRSTWLSKYSDAGVSWFTLSFKDARQEAGFAASLSSRLAIRLIFIGVSLIVANGTYILKKYSELQSHRQSFDQVEIERRHASFLVDSIMFVIGTASASLGILQHRRSCFRPRMLEAIVSFIAIVCLLYPVVTDRRFLVQVLGHPKTDGSPDFVAIGIDTLITILSLMPVRWGSIWMVYIIALLWFDVAHLAFLNAGSAGHVPQILPMTSEYPFVLFVLIACAMVGKRGFEFQERQLFQTVAIERTKRVQTEFELSQHESRSPSRTPPASRKPQSIASSRETERIFEGGISSGNLESTLSSIQVIAAREQWLLNPEDLFLDTSKVLGSGSSGVVFLGSHRDRPVAAKLSLELTSESMSTCVTELRVLRKLQHPNIVAFYGTLIDAPRQSLALILEFVSGHNLDDYVKRFRALGMLLADSDSYRISCGLARALCYLHSQRPAIVHGDLKPGNVLVECLGDSPPRAKLADFGLSRILSGATRSLGGTVVWMAPELVQGNPSPNIAVDAYGLGQLLLFMLSSRSPFAGWRRRMVLTALQSGMTSEPDRPKGLSKLASDVWSVGLTCIAANPLDRPTVAGILDQLQQLSTTLDGLDADDPLASDANSSQACGHVGDGEPGCAIHGQSRRTGSMLPPSPQMVPWAAAMHHIKVMMSSSDSEGLQLQETSAPSHAEQPAGQECLRGEKNADRFKERSEAITLAASAGDCGTASHAQTVFISKQSMLNEGIPLAFDTQRGPCIAL